MAEFIDVRTATALKEDAQKIAKALVAQRCAASSQVSGPIESFYWWKGKIVTAEEWAVTAKTRSDLYQEVEQTIRHLHPYEEPGIIAFSIATGSASYFQWLTQETRAQETKVILENTDILKRQILNDFDKAYERLIEAATSALGRGVRARGKEWGPREVLTHIAGWAAQATAQLPQVITGLPPIAYDSDAQHAGLDDAANAAFIALIGNQTFEQVLEITHQTHARFVEMLEAQDTCIFAPGQYVYERLKRVIDHHIQHAQELDGMS